MAHRLRGARTREQEFRDLSSPLSPGHYLHMGPLHQSWPVGALAGVLIPVSRTRDGGWQKSFTMSPVLWHQPCSILAAPTP